MKLLLLSVVYATAVVILGFTSAQAQADYCQPGFEPDTPFPNCTVRRTDMLKYMFSALTGMPYANTTNYSALCISDSAWSTMYSQMAWHPYYFDFMGYMLQCYNTGQPVLCWNYAVPFSCNCWYNCTVVEHSQAFLDAYVVL